MKSYRKVLIGAAIFVVLYFSLLILIQYGKLLPSVKKIDGIEEQGKSFEELSIPADVKVVGIGEATHGNAEFQTAKLMMLQKLVETGKCHSIAFEMSPGEAGEINEAIHSEDSDIAEQMSRSDYPLYDTQQMIELVSWMKEYNKGKSIEESLMFYGVDSQGGIRDMEYLKAFGEKHNDVFTEEEISLLDKTINSENQDLEGFKSFINDLTQRLEAKDEYEYKYAAKVAEILIQYIDAPDFDEDKVKGSEYRDNAMAENVKRFYDLEVERGYSQILITAHNGHSMKGMQDGYEVPSMGQRIYDLFEGSYYSVGTAYYNTCVNIHVAGTFDDEYLREDYNFCSDDILAYQAQYFDGGFYCLNFDEITDKNSELYKRIHTPGLMGLVGEGYSGASGLNKVDRVKLVQGDIFDAVMYYYDVTPIRVLDY